MRWIIKVRNKLRRTPLSSYNRIEISGQALRDNSRVFHTLTGGNVIPVLKGNAYGHGIAQVASSLNVDRASWMPYLAVDSYAEALQVRQFSKMPVLILGKLQPANIARIDQRDFTFVVSDKQSIIAMGSTRRHIKLHLELNSGMNRYGIPPEASEEYIKLIKGYPNLELEGVMSHLADSDGTALDTVIGPVTLFDNALDTIERLMGPIRFKHIAQTAGSVRVESKHANAIRIGIGLYGVNPFSLNHPCHARLRDIRPCLCLISTVSQIQKVGVGEGVGYNYSFRAQRPSRIAVLPVGYYEGVPSIFAGKVSVQLKSDGRSLPVVGQVCMNHMTIDVTGTKVDVNDEVVIINNQANATNSLQSLSEQLGLSPREIMVRVAAANRRIVVD